MGAFGVGGIATFEEFCPLDKLVVKFFEALKKLHEEYKGGKDDGEKMLFGKYTAKEAFTQIDSAVKMWCAKSGLEHKLEEEAPAAAPDGMEAMAMEEAMEGSRFPQTVRQDFRAQGRRWCSHLRSRRFRGSLLQNLLNGLIRSRQLLLLLEKLQWRLLMP